MEKEKKEETVTVKQILVIAASIITVLIGIIGYFTTQKLSGIDQSIREFTEFQKTQIEKIEVIKGEIKLLHAKDLEIEKKVEAKNEKNN